MDVDISVSPEYGAAKTSGAAFAPNILTTSLRWTQKQVRFLAEGAGSIISYAFNFRRSEQSKESDPTYQASRVISTSKYLIAFLKNFRNIIPRIDFKLCYSAQSDRYSAFKTQMLFTRNFFSIFVSSNLSFKSVGSFLVSFNSNERL